MPEPVRPRPRMSLPARASGMVAAWIGNGVVTPFWASLRTTPSGRPRESKVISGAASTASTVSTVSTAAWTPSLLSLLVLIGHDDVISTGNRHAKCEPSGVLRHAPNSVKSQSTASMRSGHGKGEYAPHAALSAMAPGKWDRTIYPPIATPEGKLTPKGAGQARRAGLRLLAEGATPAVGERIPASADFPRPLRSSTLRPSPPPVHHPVHAGWPACGAGCRSTSCVVCSCAEDEGSPVVGSGVGVTGGGGGGGGGVGSDVACVGLGTPFDGGGCSGCPLPSPLPVALVDGFAPPEADADADADQRRAHRAWRRRRPSHPSLRGNRHRPRSAADAPSGA